MDRRSSRSVLRRPSRLSRPHRYPLRAQDVSEEKQHHDLCRWGESWHVRSFRVHANLMTTSILLCHHHTPYIRAKGKESHDKMLCQLSTGKRKRNPRSRKIKTADHRSTTKPSSCRGVMIQRPARDSAPSTPTALPRICNLCHLGSDDRSELTSIQQYTNAPLHPWAPSRATDRWYLQIQGPWRQVYDSMAELCRLRG
jgi:hypothetical protein